jgi:phosphoserine phosphatase
VLHAAPGAAWTAVLHLLEQKDTRALKEKAFAFLRHLDDVDRIVQEFWQENSGKIAEWYLEQRRDDDLILSASPEFLLRPIADSLGVQLIATQMDRHTGKIIGKNCHDNEKVVRFYAKYPNVKPERFYSDSLSDAPMARIAQQAFLIRNGVPVPWPVRR